jgi:hypothetical protein
MQKNSLSHPPEINFLFTFAFALHLLSNELLNIGLDL